MCLRVLSRRSLIMLTVRLLIFILMAIFGAPIGLLAQNNTVNRPRSPLEASQWGIVYDIPATKNVKLHANVPYQNDSGATLKMDIYTPPNLKSGMKLPTVVFLNAVGDRPNDSPKDWGIYKTWARLIATQGFVGITMEADGARIQDSLRRLFDTLQKDGAKYGIDASKIGVYAASANVHGALEYMANNDQAKIIRAAVLYYGFPPEDFTLRPDIPVLFVTAETDAGRMGAPLAGLWQKVIETRLPWTLVFAKNMPHAFDAFSDTNEARRIIEQTIAFWKINLGQPPQPAWKPSKVRETLAVMYSNDLPKTADALAGYVAEYPNDAEAFSQYGRVLAQLRRYDDAGKALERAQSLGLNDPGVFSGLAQVRMSQKRWEESAQWFQKAIDGGLRNSLTYGQLAFVQLVLNQNEESIKSYEKAFEQGIPPGANTRGLAYFNLATAYVRLKQNDKAFEVLNKAVDEGMTNRAAFENDTDLAPLRTDERFKKLIARLAGSGR